MILITGANGFIGQALTLSALRAGHSVIATARQLPHPQVATNSQVNNQFKSVSYVIKSIDGHTDWQTTLLGVESVVHCAARVHRPNESSMSMLDAYHEINVNGTLCLARQAANAGVKRFVFLSTIGVNGNQTSSPFTESDEPNPQSAYAVSKLEAENGLFEIAAHTGLEVVIIRPPLVYGPNVRGNFSELVRWIQSGIPMPLGSLHNKRSFVAIDNLIDLILMCADPVRSSQAANQIFLVSDNEDISITLLLEKVALAAGCPSRLVPVHPRLLFLLGHLFGKSQQIERLVGNLQVDTSKVRTLLNWQPVVTIDQGLSRIFTRF